MAGLSDMKVKIGIDLSDLKKGASDASTILSDVGRSAATVAPSFSKSAAAADALEAALDKIGNQGRANIDAIAAAALKTGGAMNTLSKNVQAFGGGVMTNNLPDYFKKVEQSATKTSAALGTTVKAGSDRAGAALTDLGRIAQDAPFGIIGIQNNISPLLESFKRLRAETGSTGSALQALATGAMGAGGLGLAVSVATGLLTVLAQKGFFNTSAAAEDAKKKIEDFSKEVQGIYDGAGKEAAQTAGLVAVLQSETATREKKLATVKELQKINPEIFAGLKLEGSAVIGLDNAYQSYLQNLRTVIAAKIIQKKLEDSISQSLQFQGATSTKTIQEAAKTLKQFNDERKAQPGAVKTFGDLKYEKQLSEENKRLNEQAELQKQLAELQKGIKVPTTDDKIPKRAKDTRDYTDILRELNEELELNNKLASIGFISSSEQDLAKISKVKSAIEQILKLPKGPGANSPVIDTLIGSIQPEEIRQQLGERSAEIVKTLKTVKPGLKDLPVIQIPITLKPSINTDRALSEIDRKLKEDFNSLAKDIQRNVLNSGLSSIGETIGAAIGGGDVANAFRGLLNVVINGMKQLGEAMIGLGTAKVALEKFNIAPGFGTIAAGIGIIALSSLIQSALPKFADGTQGFRGGLSIVGERGPEIVQLPQGANVIPNHQLAGITGGSTQVYIPSIALRGSDLLISFKRAEAQANRRG